MNLPKNDDNFETIKSDNNDFLHWHDLFDIFFYWNLQFINNVIIIKTKIRIPRTYVTLVTDYGFVTVLHFERIWWR